MGRGKSTNMRSHSYAPNTDNLPAPSAESMPFRRELPPNVPHTPGGYTGTVICPRCHAIWENKHWHLDEAQYDRLREDADIEKVICPACEKIEREEFDGQVTLRSPLIPRNEEAILGLIYNTEASVRQDNPLARIASLEVKGDTVEILTITPFLADRIGKELRKAYDGQLDIKHSERARFTRVIWVRE
ncbi:MAG TPA: BCAM0308 family protein [Oscillatoriaceae cyanobacterium]